MTTKALLEQADNFDFPIIPLSIENGYTWTSGLNAPVYTLASKLSPEAIEKTSVINLSYDVDMTDEELQNLEENLKNNQYTFSVRHSADGSLENKYNNQDIILENAKKVIRGEELTEKETIELVYFLRNTLGVFPLQQIMNLWGFNPLCNNQNITTLDGKSTQIAGMEDLDIWVRMLKQKDFSSLKGLLKSMKSPVFYTDEAWKNLPEIDRIFKWTNEKLALIQIFGWQSLGLIKDWEKIDFSDDYIVPEKLRDFTIKQKEND